MSSRFVLPFADVGSGITPEDGAQLFFFITGTDTPKDTFSNEALTTPNANPVIADANGLFSDIWMPDGGRYTVTLKDKNDVQQWTSNPVIGGGSSSVAKEPFNTVATMVASKDLNIGEIVNTAGYVSKGDGGQNQYEIVAAATGTVDGGSFIDLTGITGQAKGLFPLQIINVIQFNSVLANAVTFAQANSKPWIINGNELLYTSATGVQVHGVQADGVDTGALTLAAGGTESSTRGAVINLYGEQHATWEGQLVLTPVTDSSLGRVSLESVAQSRRGFVVNGRWDLVQGVYDLEDVADPGGSLLVFGDAGTLGTDPAITGFTAQTNADLGVFQQKTTTNGITIGTENNVAGRIAFGDPDNSGAGQLVYDHSDDSMRFNNVNGEVARFRSNGIMLLGKITSDIAVVGLELDDAGLINVTATSAICGRWNRLGSDGTVQEVRNDGSLVGSISISGATTAYNTTSDRRLKENIKEYDQGINDVKKLATKLFNMIADPDKTQKIGWIAQEVQEFFPSMVTEVVDESALPEVQDLSTQKRKLKSAQWRKEQLEDDLCNCRDLLDGCECEQTIEKLADHERKVSEQLASLDLDAEIIQCESEIERLESLIPGAVEAADNILMIDHSTFVPMLAAGINDLSTAIDAQAELINSLSERLSALENK